MECDANITIIGAGVIGLAIANELSKYYTSVFVIEKLKNFGEETSSRSSEVIHSGVYYPSDSLKAKLCVKGRKMLYNFCSEFGVTYNKCGKLIIASSEEDLEQLDMLKIQGMKNGVNNIKKISAKEVEKLEPNIKALGALVISDTGVIDSYGFMKALEGNSKDNGVEFVYRSEVVYVNKQEKGYQIKLLEDGGSVFSFTSNILINAAGLNSDTISNLLGITNLSYKLNYCKGEYFAIGNNKCLKVKRLIYPVPNANLTGLGVHVTISVDGGLKLGPNAFYLKDRTIDYTVDKDHSIDFFKSAKRFLPFLEKEDLYPAYAGIRPKLQAKGDLFRDFVIQEEKEKGFENYFNLIGIESPGLTASLAIGEYVNRLIKMD